MVETGYSLPKEIADSGFVSSITVKKESPRVYSGKVTCFETGPEAGTFSFKFRAKRIKGGEYEVTPTSREGIELGGMLKKDRFTHSPDFDRALKQLILETILSN